MSEKYPGGLITKTPVTPTGPYQTGAASGVWTRDQQLQYQQQGIWPIAGNSPPYIEDVFSTYLYTGNSSTQTITNGIDLAGKGGMVWSKSRTTNPSNHGIIDTVRGNRSSIYPNLTGAQDTAPNDTYGISGFNSTGYGIASSYSFSINNTGSTYVSWTFRKQPKFFDVVTGTGQGTFSHNLGVLPGCIILKRTSTTGNWIVAHTGLTGGITGTYACLLNTADAQSDQGVSLSPTATTFSPSAYVGSSDTWVAYLFASNAGGFGAAGTDNVITCGSYTEASSGTTNINLGFEPQFLLMKGSTASTNWVIFDNMRGFSNTGDNRLSPDNPYPEVAYTTPYFSPTATGFSASSGFFGSGVNVIYIAIRRGPMKTPTTGTSVYNAIARTGTGADATITGVGFPVDLSISQDKTAYPAAYFDRLRGATYYIRSNNTNTETTAADSLVSFANMDGVVVGPEVFTSLINVSGEPYINWYLKRAPGFFDEVCYAGTGSATTVAHNLGVAPELMIVKSRSGGVADWSVYSLPTTATNFLSLNKTDASAADSTYWNSTTPTSSVFSVGTQSSTNNSGYTYVAYLFATLAGVSKVGSYTGNGTTQTINCGFAGGTRLVIIKRTDSTGDWYIYDTVRGMTTLTDPYLRLNTAQAQVSTLGSVTTVTTGFAVNAAVLAAINTNAASYIFLAIA